MPAHAHGSPDQPADAARRRADTGRHRPSEEIDRGEDGSDADAACRAAARRAPFRPAWWLPGPHAQTIAGRLLRRPGPLPLRRERIETPDNDFLDLDFVAAALPRDAPLALVLHGLEGSTRRGYMRLTFHAFASRGVRAVGLNFRSCSGEINRAARLYHSGETSDIRHVLDRLVERNGGRPLLAIGYSLGGNALLKYLGEEGEAARERVNAAAAISVPYDLGAGADALERTAIGRFYTSRFLRTLAGKALSKAALLDGRCDIDRIRRARTFREFDDAATAPIHGFAGADDYYSRCSSAAWLHRVRVPTLLIQSDDDPFQPGGGRIALDAAARNDFVEALVTERGGHVGFLGGSPWRPSSWVEEIAAAWLVADPPPR